MSPPRPPQLEHAAVAKELVRALRGRRSQNGFSRRLGYRSNVVRRWETGECWPTAARFLEGCRRAGLDITAGYRALCKRRPDFLDAHEAQEPAAVAAFLRDLRGRTPIGQLARAVGVNRFTVSRWLQGSAQPKLPQYLLLIDVAAGRLHDYVATLADPKELPSLREGFAQLTLMRKLAYEEPWSHAVVRALQLSPLRGGCSAAAISNRLGLETPKVERLLKVLQRAGQVSQHDGQWVAAPLRRVDTGADAVRARRLKSTWTRVALDRLETGSPGVFGYSLFEVSAADIERLRTLQLEYIRALQAIVASSDGTECIGLYCAQLLDLAGHADNALAGE